MVLLRVPYRRIPWIPFLHIKRSIHILLQKYNKVKKQWLPESWEYLPIIHVLQFSRHETVSFKAWNCEFHGMKLWVSRHETVSFKAWNCEFHALDFFWNKTISEYQLLTFFEQRYRLEKNQGMIGVACWTFWRFLPHSDGGCRTNWEMCGPGGLA